jgi:hypothetical protein
MPPNEDLQARTNELTEAVESESEQRGGAEAARAGLEVIVQSFGDAALFVDASGAILHATSGYWQLFGDPGVQLVAHDSEGHSLPTEASPIRRAESAS